MESPEMVTERWKEVVEHVGYAPPQYAPLHTLIQELTRSEASHFAWPIISHFSPRFIHAAYSGRSHWDTNRLPLVSVEYWPQVDRFKIRFYRFQGVPFDQKWCGLPEAAATLRYAFPRLKIEPGAVQAA